MQFSTSLFILMTVTVFCSIIAVSSADNDTVEQWDKLKYVDYPIGSLMKQRTNRGHAYTAIASNDVITVTNNIVWIYEKYIKTHFNGKLFVLYCEPDDIPLDDPDYRHLFFDHVCSTENDMIIYVKKTESPPTALKPGDDYIRVAFKFRKATVFMTCNLTTEQVILTTDPATEVGKVLPVDFNPRSGEILKQITLKYRAYMQNRTAQDDLTTTLYSSASTPTLPPAKKCAGRGEERFILRAMQIINLEIMMFSLAVMMVMLLWDCHVPKPKYFNGAQVVVNEGSTLKYLKSRLDEKLEVTLEKAFRQRGKLIETEDWCYKLITVGEQDILNLYFDGEQKSVPELCEILTNGLAGDSTIRK